MPKKKKADAHSGAGPAVHLDYQYKPLKGVHPIRLIALQPAKHDLQELKCDIIHADIGVGAKKQRPLYTALSYAWGDSSLTHVLHCGASKIRITASLHAALLNLRYTKGNHLIWADAVCINQADQAEKTQQIKKMIWVYAMARLVACFLGEEYDDGDKALWCIQELAKAPTSSEEHAMVMEEHVRQTVGSVFGLQSLQPLSRFFRRSWFSRKWVIQESAAALKSIVVCGAVRVSWEDFIAGVQVLLDRKSMPWDIDEDDIDRNTLVSLAKIDHLRTQWMRRCVHRGCVSNPSLPSLLSEFESFDCSDERDHIFALIGIAEAVPTISASINTGKYAWTATELKEPTFVDYNYHPTEVYKSFAKDCFKAADSYSLLNCAGAFYRVFIEEEDDILPSWVPDWRAKSRFKPFLSNKFKSGIRSNEVQSIMVVRDCLISRGLSIDTITSCSSGLVAYDLSSQDIPKLIRDCGQILNPDFFTEQYQASESSKSRDLAMALIAGGAFHNQSSHKFDQLDKFDTKALQQSIEGFNEIVKGICSFPKGEDDPKCPLWSLWWSNAALKYMEMAIVAMQGRRFFITSRGLLGIGPGRLGPGHTVAVLFGLRTPFVIELLTGNFEARLMGDAYVYGVMDGEAFNMPEAAEREFAFL
ncbi:heterokaryon incompatibility protein-domain-containing protein [Leptodontidium sp. MPI-SDFR-AT-0119]|nr:heterokaryon incompatibility protein-domain-containing protein [Leptodontidium sp. MPI-SDFR-AT-0119]